MISKYLIEKFKQDVVETYSDEAIQDESEKIHLEILHDLLVTNEYLINAMVNDFNLEAAPGEVYLFDLERSMFWKGRYGYTRDIYSAGAFNLAEAIDKAESDITKKTKIVYFE